MPPIARAVPSRNNCAGGEVLTGFTVRRRKDDSRHTSENDETRIATALIVDYSLFPSHLHFPFLRV